MVFQVVQTFVRGDAPNVINEKLLEDLLKTELAGRKKLRIQDQVNSCDVIGGNDLQVKVLPVQAFFDAFFKVLVNVVVHEIFLVLLEHFPAFREITLKL